MPRAIKKKTDPEAEQKELLVAYMTSRLPGVLAAAKQEGQAFDLPEERLPDVVESAAEFVLNSFDTLGDDSLMLMLELVEQGLAAEDEDEDEDEGEDEGDNEDEDEEDA